MGLLSPLSLACVAGQGKQGGQWAEFLWGLIIGLELSLASYSFGEQCALLIERWLVPSGAENTSLEGRQAMYAPPHPCLTSAWPQIWTTPCKRVRQWVGLQHL